jgi:hypothetical protein
VAVAVKPEAPMTDLERKLRELVDRNQHDGWVRNLGIQDLSEIVRAAANLGAEAMRERCAQAVDGFERSGGRGEYSWLKNERAEDAIRALPLPSEK